MVVRLLGGGFIESYNCCAPDRREVRYRFWTEIQGAFLHYYEDRPVFTFPSRVVSVFLAYLCDLFAVRLVRPISINCMIVLLTTRGCGSGVWPLPVFRRRSVFFSIDWRF